MALLSVNRLQAVHSCALSLVTLLFALCHAAPPTFGAEGFRIATKIYLGEEDKKDTKLVSESTTLFDKGVVYDFLADGSQTAVFRKPAGKEGRFILLNPDE